LKRSLRAASPSGFSFSSSSFIARSTSAQSRFDAYADATAPASELPSPAAATRTLPCYRTMGFYTSKRAPSKMWRFNPFWMSLLSLPSMRTHIRAIQTRPMKLKSVPENIISLRSLSQNNNITLFTKSAHWKGVAFVSLISTFVPSTLKVHEDGTISAKRCKCSSRGCSPKKKGQIQRMGLLEQMYK